MVSETRDSPIGKIPGNWEVRPLASFCSKIGTGATPRGGQAVYLTGRLNYALIRSQHVFDRHFDFDDLAYISDEHAYELRYAEVQSNDLLLNITGDGVTFGRACLVPEGVLPACVNQHVSIIRVDRSVCSPGYLLSFFTHPLVKPYIESFNSGGSRRAITKGNIESFEIPLPPIAEQERVADILGTLDDKIALNGRMNETLEGMAQAIFKSWFVDFDPVKAKQQAKSAGKCAAEIRRATMAALSGTSEQGVDELNEDQRHSLAKTADLFPDEFEESEIGEIPNGWTLRTLSELCETNRQTWKTSDAPDHVEYVDLGNAKDGEILATETFDWKDAPSRARRVTAPGDTIIGTVRPGNRSFALIPNTNGVLTASTGFSVADGSLTL